MNTEIELKFLVSPEFIAHLPSLLTGYEICHHDQKTLVNTYFDTPNLALGQLKAGLRIRQQNGKLEQTVKLAGSQVGGLHQRPEYNIDLSQPQPDLNLFPAKIWPLGFAVAQVQADLRPLFSTDFVRERWLVKFQDTEIELALDVGEVGVQEKIDPIQELELELVSGKVTELFAFAERLLTAGGMRLSDVSKAQRGYQLAGLAQRPQLQTLSLPSKPLSDPQAPDTAALLNRLSQGVEHWQHHEQGLLTHGCDNNQTELWLAQVRAGVALVAQSLALLEKLRADARLSHWLVELTWLQAELAADHDLAELFYSARYGGLLLQLTHYLYAQRSH